MHTENPSPGFILQPRWIYRCWFKVRARDAMPGTRGAFVAAITYIGFETADADAKRVLQRPAERKERLLMNEKIRYCSGTYHKRVVVFAVI